MGSTYATHAARLGIDMTDLQDKIAAIIDKNLPQDYGGGVKAANALIADLPDLVAPLVWDGRNDGSLITVCDTYEITKDGKHWKLCTCAFAGGYMGHSDKQSSLTTMANAYHSAAVVAAITGEKP